MATRSNIILGIDPGYADTGYGLISTKPKLHYLSAGTIRTAAGQSLERRLQSLAQNLDRLMTTWQPELMAVETLFFMKNAKTAMAVAQARGVIILKAAEHGLRLMEFSPLQVKQGLTSYGQADKRQVARMVARLLDSSALPEQDDAVDALAIAICAAFSQGRT